MSLTVVEAVETYYDIVKRVGQYELALDIAYAFFKDIGLPLVTIEEALHLIRENIFGPERGHHGGTNPNPKKIGSAHPVYGTPGTKRPRGPIYGSPPEGPPSKKPRGPIYGSPPEGPPGLPAPKPSEPLPPKKDKKMGGEYAVDQSAKSTYDASKKVYGAKKVRQARKKSVKVSPYFRKKVSKVIEAKKIHGTLTEHTLGGYMTCIDRQQSVYSDPFGGVGVAKNLLSFTLDQFLDGVSQLFNEKPPEKNKATLLPGSAQSFDSLYTKFHVKNCWTSLHFKNLTPHTVIIKFWVCAPKKKYSWKPDQTGQTVGMSSLGAVRTVSDGLGVPMRYWLDSLAIDNATGYIKNRYYDGGVTAPQAQDLYREPTQSKTFNNGWKVEKIEFILEPGQDVKHLVQGPKNIDIDLQKAEVNDTFQNVQKFSRGYIYAVYNGLNSCFNGSTDSAAASYGRFADRVDVSQKGYGIAVERTDHYSFSMPEQTGFTLPVGTSGTKTLELRRPRSITNIFDVAPPSAVGGSQVQCRDLSKENPVVPVSDQAP